jgi:hypothetical protein
MELELDRLIRNGSFEDVKSYIERNPLSVREQCPDSGTLPLHRLLFPSHCEFEKDWPVLFSYDILHRKEKVHLLVETYPEGLTVKDNDGQIPLHAAVGDRWLGFEENSEAKALEVTACVLKAFQAGSLFRDLNGTSGGHFKANRTI